MAAVIAPQHQPDLRPLPRPRPSLRVIDGGRRPGDPWVPGPRAVVRPPRATGGRLPARVYRERRIAVAVALVVLLGVLALALVGATAVVGAVTSSPGDGAVGPTPAVAAPVAPAPVEPAPEWVVQPGDTLWSIAAELRPEGDVRELVDALADRAGGASLQAGQRIPLDGLVS